jgi:hypothetical protein
MVEGAGFIQGPIITTIKSGCEVMHRKRRDTADSLFRNIPLDTDSHILPYQHENTLVDEVLS